MAADSEVEVETAGEEEEEENSAGPHSHEFTVKFPNNREYKIDCTQPRTVLEAIKSDLNEQFAAMGCTDEKIIIQLSKKGRESIVATHFPCSCIRHNECLTIKCEEEEVEKAQGQHDEIDLNDEYSVFFIFKEGGKNAKSQKLFTNSAVKEFDYLCVYAKKGMTVGEALERDGRFVDLKDFKLSEVDNSSPLYVFTHKVDKLNQKKFKICRDRKIQTQQKSDTKSVLDEAQQRGISVKRAMEEMDRTVNTTTIHNRLCEQFPREKNLLETRFPRESYQEELKLKENFGKIQQSFSEVHRVRQLLQLGESVCKVIVRGVSKGTGFVLFDRLILTNALMFRSCVEGNELKEGTDVYALFNYDEPEPNTNYYTFTANKTLIDFNLELDYAILELKVQSQSSNQTETEEGRVPPGLLSKFGPLPKDGAACVLGHPAGGVKKMDPTCIIVKEEREQAVNQNLQDYRDHIFTLHSINQEIRKDPYADVLVTSNSFMYHGSSGSPVFDAHGRVVGLHSGGFFFGFVKPKESVTEFAYPLLTIFESFVHNLNQSGNNELLERVRAEAEGNPYLEQIIESVVGHAGQFREVEE